MVSKELPDPAARGFPELAGPQEAAKILRVSRQRVNQLAERHPGFPRPVARLSCAPVWLAEEIREYDEQWVRRAGRPPKNKKTPTVKEELDGQQTDT